MRTEFRLALLATLLGACASVPRDAGFAEAADLAHERGGLELVWRRGGPEEAELDARVHALLAVPLDADGAVAIALLQNRRLQALYSELGFAQAEVLQAARIPNPLLHLEARLPSGGGLSALDLGLEQDFLSLLLMPQKKRLAAETFEVAKLRVSAGALELAAETRVAFLRLQGGEQRLALAHTALEAAEASFELAQRLSEAGNLRELDLALEQAQREEARVAVADAELATIEAREALVAHLGLYGTEARLDTLAPLADLPADDGLGVDLEARAIAASLTLAMRRHEIERAGRVLGLEETTRFLPELDLALAAERETDGSWQLGPGLGLELPLFSQGQPELRRAAAELERLRATYVADAVELRSRVRAAAARVRALHARASFLRDGVLPLRARILEELQREYNAMQVSAFRLLLAKREELGAEMSYAATLADYWVARGGLDSLLAGVSPAPASARSALSPSMGLALNSDSH